MAKWADYLISAIRYDKERKHIEKVKVHEDLGDKIGAASTWSRSSVVSSIEGDKSFLTIIKSSNGEWRKGSEVHIIEVNKKKYLRTDRNKKESDNLGNLPEF